MMEKEQFDQLVKLLKEINKSSVIIADRLASIDATLEIMGKPGFKQK